jgi:hypothetical protein
LWQATQKTPRKHTGIRIAEVVLGRQTKIVIVAGQNSANDGECRMMKNLMSMLSKLTMVVLVVALLADVAAIMCSLEMDLLMVSAVMMLATAYVLGVWLFLCDEYGEEEKL